MHKSRRAIAPILKAALVIFPKNSVFFPTLDKEYSSKRTFFFAFSSSDNGLLQSKSPENLNFEKVKALDHRRRSKVE